MSRKIHFSVEGSFDSSKQQIANITVDRDSGMTQIRIHGRRDFLELPTASLFTAAYQKHMAAKAMEAKKPRRRLAKRGLLSVGG